MSNPNQLALANIIPGAAFTPTALTLSKAATTQTLDDLGRVLGQIDKASNWWIGDYVLHRRAHSYHYDRDAISAATGIDANTITRAGVVADFYPPEARRESLSWSHHREAIGIAAHLDATAERLAAANAVLDLAEKNKWSVSDLTQHIRRSLAEQPVRPVTPAAAPAQEQPAAVTTAHDESGAEVHVTIKNQMSRMAEQCGLDPTSMSSENPGLNITPAKFIAAPEVTPTQVAPVVDPGPIRLPVSELIAAIAPAERAARALLLEAWEPDAETAKDLRGRMRYLIDLADMLREGDDAIDVETRAAA